MPVRSAALIFVLFVAVGAASGENAAAAGKLTEELPTVKCLGFRWLIGGDDNHNARVRVEYRKTGAKQWRRALDLFGVETRGMRKVNRPPAGQRLFAGSIFDLAPGTRYEVKLSLEDPDGGSAVRTTGMTTWTAPTRPIGGRKISVRPGGLKAALKSAKPGDGIDTFSNYPCAAIDIYGNEISECTDDGFKGKAPDLGAYELGAKLPHYGPRR